MRLCWSATYNSYRRTSCLTISSVLRLCPKRWRRTSIFTDLLPIHSRSLRKGCSPGLWRTVKTGKFNDSKYDFTQYFACAFFIFAWKSDISPLTYIDARLGQFFLFPFPWLFKWYTNTMMYNLLSSSPNAILSQGPTILIFTIFYISWSVHVAL